MSEGIQESSLLDDPIKQFEQWFTQANDSGVQDANAFSLATADSDGRPSVRTVLLKLFDAKGFVFFTNYNSRSEEHTFELQSHFGIAYAVFCL